MGNSVLDIFDLIWKWFSVTVPDILEFFDQPLRELPGFDKFPSSVLDSGLFDGSLLELIFSTSLTFMFIYLVSPIVKWVLGFFK